MGATMLLGDVMERLASLENESFDAMLTDPPYGLEFMGRGWDKVVPPAEVWREILRVLKPGAFGLVFGGTRTFHRLAVALEDAGFELRDTLMWVYGSGFPKSHDVSKAIDKAAGAEREVVGSNHNLIGRTRPNGCIAGPHKANADITAPATPEAERWQGYGTALKPAWEPVLLVRKPTPLTYAANAIEHECGALNIDGCRVPTDDNLNGGAYADSGGRQELPGDGRTAAGQGMFQPGKTVGQGYRQPEGRWPANLIHDGSAEVTDLFPQTSATSSAARFFYTAKASPTERNTGLSGRNHHPTVKPLALTEYLAKLLLPPGEGRLLVPFSGSGSEAIGAYKAGWKHITLIEREPEYMQIARQRLLHHIKEAA